MKLTHTLAYIFIAGILSCTAFARDPYMVVTRDGKKVGAAKITPERGGDLTLTFERGSSTVIRRRDVYRIYTPTPSVIESLKDLSKAGKHDQVISGADKIYDQLKYLGWADDIKAIQAGSYLATGNEEKALEALEEGIRYTTNAQEASKLYQVRIDVYLQQNKLKDAKALLDKLDLSDDDGAPLGLSIRAKLAEKDNRPQDAAQDYLRIILLYRKADERKEAYDGAIRTLKQINDPIWKDLEAEMAKEF